MVLPQSLTRDTTNDSFLLPEWRGISPVGARAILCELVAAEISASQDPEGTRWISGSNPGFDVVSDGLEPDTPIQRDAKSVRLDGNIVTLTRTDAKPFNPAKVDLITMVVAEVGLGFASTLGEDGKVFMTAQAQIRAVWDVPVEVVNDLMAAPGQREEGATTRVVTFTLECLEPHKVDLSPLPSTELAHAVLSQGIGR